MPCMYLKVTPGILKNHSSHFVGILEDSLLFTFYSSFLRSDLWELCLLSVA